MNKMFFFFLLFSFFIKLIYSTITTNSPIYCLLGKVCELQVISNNEELDDTGECTLNEDKTICTCTYNTTDESHSNTCNGYNFTIIVFSMTNEDEQFNITIENYDELKNITINASDDYESYSNNGSNLIVFGDYYSYAEGELKFMINGDESTKKSIDSGQIFLPVISLQIGSPSYISTIETLEMERIIPIQSKNFKDFFISPKFLLNNIEYDLISSNQSLEGSDGLNYTFYFTTKEISFPPSNSSYFGNITYQSVFTNQQMLPNEFIPVDLEITDEAFLVGVSPKKLNVSIVFLGNNYGINYSIKVKNSSGDEFSSNYSDGKLELNFDEYGTYYLYINNNYEYDIKSSAKVLLLYPISFAENQISYGRFLAPYTISIYLLNIIQIDKVYAVLYNVDTKEQDDTIEITLSCNVMKIESIRRIQL